MTRLALPTGIAGWSVSSDLSAEPLGGGGPTGGGEAQMAAQKR